jgi:DNA polymerase III delta prime subunit
LREICLAEKVDCPDEVRCSGAPDSDQTPPTPHLQTTRQKADHICATHSTQALDALIKTSDGDLRRAITYLQSAARLHAATSEPITAVSVQEIGGVVPDPVMRELARALGVRDEEDGEGDVEMGGTGQGGSRFERVRKAVEKVIREGYSSVQVLSQVRRGFSLSLSSSLLQATRPHLTDHLGRKTNPYSYTTW